MADAGGLFRGQAATAVQAPAALSPSGRHKDGRRQRVAQGLVHVVLGERGRVGWRQTARDQRAPSYVERCGPRCAAP